MQRIVMKAPAKINLGLNIVGKRADGFHDLEMVMASIDLNDYLYFETLSRDEIVIESNQSFLPTNRKNLVYQAADLIKKQYHISKGVKIVIEKTIPISAGLAGGSSDAAATLRGLNDLWQLNLDLKRLQKLGEAIGSDVPYCLSGGCAFVTGRGEVVEPLPKLPHMWIVIVKPSFGLSTADIFSSVKLDEVNQIRINDLKEAVLKKDYQGICSNMGNVLEPIAIAQKPEIQKIKYRLSQAGADGVLMTGSGPTVFALCSTERKANRVFNSIKGYSNEIYKVRIFNEKLM